MFSHTEGFFDDALSRGSFDFVKELLDNHYVNLSSYLTLEKLEELYSMVLIE